MKYTAPRTCTEVSSEDLGQRLPRPLAEYRDTPAYVLLGDPGSGKTTAFETEKEVLGDRALLIAARDFITFDPENRPEWRRKTLFVDGLDEVRAGQSDARTPFDAIRGRLDALGKPAYRLSCRAADWLGLADRSKLNDVSPIGKVAVLNLDPLSESDISQILNARPEISDPTTFIKEARERGVGGLLRNPQNLDLLVKLVVDGGKWPEGRKQTFEGACRQLAADQNTEHMIGVDQPYQRAQVLDTAGRLCSVQLIAGTSGFASRQLPPDEEYIDPSRCSNEGHMLLQHALSTRLFSVDAAGVARPVHRHIAEFIGATHLARLIEGGLPANRVIALMTGEDGLVVTELRGLSAWLAAICRPARATLIDLDPIGVGLYGDIRDFSREEKDALLTSLMGQVSNLNPYFAAPAFAGLATPDNASAIYEVLTDADRSSEHQSFAGFLLFILASGQPMEDLSETLLDIVYDQTWRADVRRSALRAFVNACQDSDDKTRKLRELLASVHNAKLEDPNNELLGTVLSQAYPQNLPPSEVWEYMYENGDDGFIGSYRMFWRKLLMEKSSDGQVAELLDHLKVRIGTVRPALERHHLNELPLELLERCLRVYGDVMEAEDLYDLLSMGSKLQHVRRNHGVSEKLGRWLERHPHILKDVIAAGLGRCTDADRFIIHTFDVYECLFGAEVPSDFGVWCLNKSIEIADTRPMAAEHLLQQAVAAFRTEKNHEGLSIDVLRNLTEDHQHLKSRLEALLSPPDSVTQ